MTSVMMISVCLLTATAVDGQTFFCAFHRLKMHQTGPCLYGFEKNDILISENELMDCRKDNGPVLPKYRERVGCDDIEIME